MKDLISIGNEFDMNINVWNWRSNSKVASNKVSSKVRASPIRFYTSQLQKFFSNYRLKPCLFLKMGPISSRLVFAMSNFGIWSEAKRVQR